ncbi:MAG: hypothetical protein PQJ49_01860 [Sphaerochaetaceae bacterium]|nr:hypothetical protein [Sphaerochaetaceae bacterium]
METLNNKAIEGYVAGETCNREGCKGIIEEHDTDGGCACHLHAPCSYCETSREFCPECGWEGADEQYESYITWAASITEDQKAQWEKERQERQKKEEEFWEKYRSDEPVDVITFRSKSHTHFSMEKIGMFPLGTSIDTVRAVVRGTFGGRFKQFNEKTGRFHYIAYTD